MLVFSLQVVTKSELCVSFLTQFAREILQFPCVELVSVGQSASSGRIAVSQEYNEYFFVERRGSSSEPSPGLASKREREISGMADGKINDFPHRKSTVLSERDGVKAVESWRPPRDLR